MANWAYEHQVDTYVRNILVGLKLKEGSGKDFNAQKAVSAYLKEALEGSSKTLKNQGGIPDFSVEKFKKIPVLIENKLHTKFLKKSNGNEIDFSAKSIQDYAANGALHYARCVIASKRYKEAIAIAVAGDDEKNVEIEVYYVFSSNEIGYKLTKTKNLDFLATQKSFDAFYKDAQLSEEEKHDQLQKAKQKLSEQAKKLNSLMHSCNITAPQRVLYISGMLLAMQDIPATQSGLCPIDLEGKSAQNKRDGILITNQIKKYLKTKITDKTKLNLMLSSFNEISKDAQRDEPVDIDTKKKETKSIAKYINGKASINKQIFTFIFEFIYKSIEGFSGHLDIMGEMYSEFLKYAMGDGKELGIVLTPPYVTKMMAELLAIDENSKVMDLATGSAGFLISAMQIMIDKAEQKHGKDTQKAINKIKEIKANQLLGVELNAEMFVLASTNMILRGDGSSRIKKGNTFSNESYYKDFNADRLLLNPPFTFDENGMPFIKIGLDNMPKGSLGAIIIQDSAGSGMAINTNKDILKSHTLLANIKMPTDLFMPMADVQTSIYVFESGTAHDFEKVVKFIDFRNDGYKRTKKSFQEVDSPELRYRDILQIYKNGKDAKLLANWDLEQCYVADFITDSGADWNFDQHKKIDTKPTLNDFKICVSDYLAWEVGNIIKESQSEPKDLPSSQKLENAKWGEFEIDDLFEIKATSQKLRKKDNIENGKFPIYSAESQNGGICGYCNKNPAFTVSNEKPFFVIFGDHTRAFNIAKNDFCVADNVKVLEPKIFNIKLILFIITIWQKGIPNLGYARHWSVAKNIKIKLPVTASGEIDFDFIESFISELENERVIELENERNSRIQAYLKATDLADTKLSADEQNALNTWNSRIWQEFKIGDLFDKKTIKGFSKKYENLEVVEKGYHVFGQNIKYQYPQKVLLDEKFLFKVEKDKPILAYTSSVGEIGMICESFYRSGDNGAFQGLLPKFTDYNKKHILFILSVLLKTFNNFGYSTSMSDVKELTIKLPVTASGEIDFDFMESFINAIQKECIKGVDSYLAKNIATTKQAISEF